jgi:hypothetical protein
VSFYFAPNALKVIKFFEKQCKLNKDINTTLGAG